MWHINYLASLLCIYILSAHAAQKTKDYVGMQTFLTRPDIECASWKVTVYDEDSLAPGYWFVAPYERNGYKKPGGSWIGPHIYDGSGELVWSGSHLFNHINVMDFGIMKVGQEKLLSMSYAVEGKGYVLDNQYNVRQTVEEGITGKTYNMHDFHTVEDGSHYLYLQRNITHASAELTKAELGYDGECSITFPGFEERDVATGEVLFKWDATGIIPMSDSTMNFSTPQERCSGGTWDYLHSNAIDKLSDGHYMISTRHSDTIYKISKDDGSIIWRLYGLGGERSDFDMGNLNFSRQHDARFREHNGTHTIISFLDNATGADPQPASSEWTRGLLVAIDENAMTASIIKSYDHPHGDRCFRRGSYQALPNGNVFIGWSEQALQSEHTSDGRLLMEAELTERRLGTYRAFKFPFVADPQYPPDIYSNTSSVGESTTTSVYASWNGATEVAFWSLYKTDENGVRTMHVTEVPRSGFETEIRYDGYAKYVWVEAVDKSGRSLGKSDVIQSTVEGNLSPESETEELAWLHEEPSHWDLFGNSNSMLKDVGIFVGGIICGAIILSFVLLVRRRGVRWWLYQEGPTYQRVSAADAADYDETKLDELPSYRDRPSGRATKARGRDLDEDQGT